MIFYIMETICILNKTKMNLKLTLNNPIHIEGDIWMVPCRVTQTDNSYKPLLKPLDCSVKNNEYSRKHLWTAKEDEMLKNIVLDKGPRAWSRISKDLNSVIHNGLDIRQGRQCRERWFNHIDPKLNKGNWTPEEDRSLNELQRQIGNKWSEISKMLKGRNENAVKNRWKSLNKRKKGQENESGLDDGLNMLELDWEEGMVIKDLVFDSFPYSAEPHRAENDDFADELSELSQ